MHIFSGKKITNGYSDNPSLLSLITNGKKRSVDKHMLKSAPKASTISSVFSTYIYTSIRGACNRL